jgi:hypothetical protein
VSEGIAVTGLATVVPEPGERLRAVSFLKERKSKKYLGRQDELAVVSAGRALAQAGLEADLGERTGLFVAVGYIPFEARDIDPVLERSLDENGRFSMARFSDGGYQRAHPLLAFRCLPNMPAFHIAANFGIEGPYHVTYPSDGQLYVALEQAVLALRERRIDRALVTGVAHQQNFLVAHHHRRVGVDPAALVDAGATAVIERAGERDVPTVAHLAELEVAYTPFDPLTTSPPADGVRGPAEPLLAVDEGRGAEIVHEIRSRDGIHARARWTP